MFAINESPLIADYTTHHISYDGLQTPLNLVSPQRRFRELEINSNQGSDKIIPSKRLFNNEFGQDNASGSTKEQIEGNSESEIEVGPTKSTSNLPLEHSSAQSVIHCIYQD